MANVLLIVLLIISIIMTGLILIQRSEGGALGIGGGGGGGGGGGLMSGRGTADLVSRMTGIFGAIFLVVCLMISIAFNYQLADKGLLDAQSAEDALVGELTTPETTPVDNATEKTADSLLNETVNSGNDTTPLEEDSKLEESDAEAQEKPQNR